LNWCVKVLGALTQVSFYVKVKSFNNFQKSRDVRTLHLEVHKV
jgi:hypothetical protein